ncbi:MAG: 2OG-Fe(II) oxygenase [Proteobacteria bacterium]|nr:2OG-Fe(II) oxygenase [Pseudomonadota bacterium]
MDTPQPTPPLELGDRLKSFDFPDNLGRRMSLDALTLNAKPFVVVSSGAGPQAEAELREFVTRHAAFAALGISVLAISRASSEALGCVLGDDPPPFILLSDPPGQLSEFLGIDGAAPVCALVAGPDRRVRHMFLADTAGTAAARALDACQALCRPVSERVVAAQAPVLLIQDVFTPALCDKLIAHWDSRDKMRNLVAGAEGNVYQTDVKRRIDVNVEDPVLLREVEGALQRRLVDDIKRAFAYVVKEAETFKIGCYEAADSGRFGPHRDNMNPTIERRRFAMSLNLNDAFEGGAVRFPEFPGTLYRPGKGAALVFSCTLLHEALPVTAGRRFGLFGFFW